MIFGTIKVNKTIVVKNSPVDHKFWNIYKQCCKNEMLNGVELVRQSKSITKGYNLFFDSIDMTSSVVSYKIRNLKLNREYKTEKDYEAV